MDETTKLPRKEKERKEKKMSNNPLNSLNNCPSFNEIAGLEPVEVPTSAYPEDDQAETVFSNSKIEIVKHTTQRKPAADQPLAKPPVTKEDTMFEKPKSNKPRREKFKNKGVRAVLVNLPLDVAEEFYALAKAEGTVPTKLARRLILDFLENNQ